MVKCSPFSGVVDEVMEVGSGDVLGVLAVGGEDGLAKGHGGLASYVHGGDIMIMRDIC